MRCLWSVGTGVPVTDKRRSCPDVLLTFVLSCTGEGICKSPAPVKPFDYRNYLGFWYEIGKIQTPGGGEYQANCVCTFSETTPSNLPLAADSDAGVVYACHDTKPDGPWLNATGILTDMDPNLPGVWTETFFPFTPIAFELKYFVVDMDTAGIEYAMEYDCSETDYCVHIFARQPIIENKQLQTLVEKANKMGLNPLNLPFVLTNHEGCW
ncbi:apolipoprotein D-like [Amphiura filiformis]|uniref:apolipoprotein D-like n=1 Tax=Amphiura filiformis TaxID=82378 RepID=UPI003B213617